MFEKGLNLGNHLLGLFHEDGTLKGNIYYYRRSHDTLLFYTPKTINAVNDFIKSLNPKIQEIRDLWETEKLLEA
jgi:hypothetical protein